MGSFSFKNDPGYMAYLRSHVELNDFVGRGRTYLGLLKHLNQTDFVSYIDMDVNREEDAFSLRAYYLNEVFQLPDGSFTTDTCPSVLEVMIALAERIDGIASVDYIPTSPDWFWEMCDNAGYLVYTDEYLLRNPYARAEMEAITQQIIEREFEPNGNGSWFPLERPEKDQRDVQIWEQMYAYLREYYKMD